MPHISSDFVDEYPTSPRVRKCKTPNAMELRSERDAVLAREARHEFFDLLVGAAARVLGEGYDFQTLEGSCSTD
jgi:hypothetical protein